MFQGLRRALAVCAVALLAACAGIGARPPAAVVAETWVSDPARGEIDSVAAWRSGEGKTLLLATDKQAHVLRVYDGDTGRFLRSIGHAGAGRGEFNRPNGIFIADDYVFVVERDNHRLQVFDLKDMSSLGDVGSDVLRAPYGLWVWSKGDGVYRVYVTDSYYTPDGRVPPDAELGERVKVFDVRIADDGLRSAHVMSFGETSGPGVLRTVESVFGDPLYGRLLVADENTGSHDVKVYSLEGRFLGVRMGRGLFNYEPEGIALIECGEEAGYWLISDQQQAGQLFRLFDRERLNPVAVFSPENVRMVDGVWFQPASATGHGDGVLYSQHDDTAVAAFRWQSIADALGLRGDCGR